MERGRPREMRASRGGGYGARRAFQETSSRMSSRAVEDEESRKRGMDGAIGEMETEEDVGSTGDCS
jgi:hypothetical protein